MKLKSQTIQPTTREENGRRIYTWKTSNLDSVSAEEQKAIQSYDAMRGLRPPSDVLISSFRTWEEVGRWYEGLQQEKIQPSPERTFRRLHTRDHADPRVDEDSGAQGGYVFWSIPEHA
ncbi:MAG: hypothetical protein WA188_05060 [Terriglobales bacterium]